MKADGALMRGLVVVGCVLALACTGSPDEYAPTEPGGTTDMESSGPTGHEPDPDDGLCEWTGPLAVSGDESEAWVVRYRKEADCRDTGTTTRTLFRLDLEQGDLQPVTELPSAETTRLHFSVHGPLLELDKGLHRVDIEAGALVELADLEVLEEGIPNYAAREREWWLSDDGGLLWFDDGSVILDLSELEPSPHSIHTPGWNSAIDPLGEDIFGLVQIGEGEMELWRYSLDPILAGQEAFDPALSRIPLQGDVPADSEPLDRTWIDWPIDLPEFSADGRFVLLAEGADHQSWILVDLEKEESAAEYPASATPAFERTGRWFVAARHESVAAYSLEHGTVVSVTVDQTLAEDEDDEVLVESFYLSSQGKLLLDYGKHGLQVQDLETGAVAPLDAGVFNGERFTELPGALWTISSSYVHRVDLETGEKDTLGLGHFPEHAVYLPGRDRVLLGTQAGLSVVLIDPTSLETEAIYAF